MAEGHKNLGGWHPEAKNTTTEKQGGVMLRFRRSSGCGNAREFAR